MAMHKWHHNPQKLAERLEVMTSHDSQKKLSVLQLSSQASFCFSRQGTSRFCEAQMNVELSQALLLEHQSWHKNQSRVF